MQVLSMFGDCPLLLLHSTNAAYIFRETNYISLVINSFYKQLGRNKPGHNGLPNDAGEMYVL